jgi:hypothetical protein
VPRTTRPPLTDVELAQLEPSKLLRLKLTNDETTRLRAISMARDEARRESVRRFRREAEPVVRDLRDAGFDIQSLSDVLSKGEMVSQSVSVLLKHLQLPYGDSVRSAIALALGKPIPAVRAAWPILMAQYLAAPMGRGIRVSGGSAEWPLGLKGALANALCAAVTDKTLPDLIALIRNPSHGESRIVLLQALRRRSKNKLVQETLQELLHDPGLRTELSTWPRFRQRRGLE